MVLVKQTFTTMGSGKQYQFVIIERVAKRYGVSSLIGKLMVTGTQGTTDDDLAIQNPSLTPAPWCCHMLSGASPTPASLCQQARTARSQSHCLTSAPHCLPQMCCLSHLHHHFLFCFSLHVKIYLISPRI